MYYEHYVAAGPKVQLIYHVGAGEREGVCVCLCVREKERKKGRREGNLCPLFAMKLSVLVWVKCCGDPLAHPILHYISSAQIEEGTKITVGK